MADGSLVPSTGVWTGHVTWGPVQVETSFEVFPSGGFWRMLIGKPLLEQSGALQDYSNDSILLTSQELQHRMYTRAPFQPLPLPCLPTAINFPSATKFSLSYNIPVQTTKSITVETPTHQDDILHIDNTGNDTLLGEVPDLAHPSSTDEMFTRLTPLGPFHPP
jgi:hypothetical protein